MLYLRVKNWTEFQHYKDRNPPWIKLHRTLLDDYEFSCLQDASKAHLMLIWLFASQCDGRVPDDPKFLQKKLGLNSLPDLKTFKDHGLLIPEQSASKPLAPSDSKVRLETEAEAYKSTEKEKDMSGKPDASPSVKEKAETLLAFLNAKTQRNYQPVDANLKFLTALLKSGVSEDDIRSVVAKKCREWTGNEKMQEYLRPATLFNATKFAQYHGELIPEERQHAVS